MNLFSVQIRWALLPILTLAVLTGCAKYKQKIADQSTQIAKLEGENDLLREEKGHMESSVGTLQTEKGALIAQNEDLQKEVDRLGTELAQAKDKIKALEAELKSMDIGKEELSKELADKKRILRDLKKRAAQAKKRLATIKNMLKKFKKLIESGKLKVKIKRGKMVLALPSAILFESGKATLSDEGKITLEEVGNVLAKIRGREFQVAGHTDNVPIKSSNYESNWELSTARAVNVVQFLQDSGVSPKFLSAAGYSQFQPDSSNKTDEGRTLNRRIEITLMPDLNELPDLSDLEKELKK